MIMSKIFQCFFCLHVLPYWFTNWQFPYSLFSILVWHYLMILCYTCFVCTAVNLTIPYFNSSYFFLKREHDCPHVFKGSHMTLFNTIFWNSVMQFYWFVQYCEHKNIHWGMPNSGCITYGIMYQQSNLFSFLTSTSSCPN